MADTFNAYHKWLGIPPKDQPPHHYRLLGVELFEVDEDVISAAADQRMVYLRSFQAGKHAAAAESLLNEIAAARVCLLSPERREPYDRALRAKSSTLPAPRPLTPGAVQQEQQLASARTVAHDTSRIVVTNTQEVALAPAPLPGKTSAPPPRKTGPLPMADYAGAPTAVDPLPALKPLPRTTPPSATKPAPDLPSGAATFFTQLPQHFFDAVLFIFQLPQLSLRSADRLLLRFAGEENRILHNFLRVIVPAVLLVALAISAFVGVRWGVPRIVAAVRERAARQQRVAARPQAVREFVIQERASAIPNIVAPPPVMPPSIAPDEPDLATGAPLAVVEPTPIESASPLRDSPIFTADVLRSQTATLETEVEPFAQVPDADLDSLDQQIGGFAYRHALRSLAHTFTFTPDVDSSDRTAIAEIVARGINSSAKQRLFAARAAEELQLPGPNWPGIVACGSIKQKLFSDGLYRTEIQLPLQPAATIWVVSEKNLAETFATRSSVFVLGGIVDKPGERIVGYSGPQQPVIWGGGFFAAPPVSDVVASLPVEPPVETPAEEPEEPEIVHAPVDPTADLVALARFATALQNTGQLLHVPDSHPLLARWIATGLVQRERIRSWGTERVEGPPDTTVFGDQSTAWASTSQDEQEEWLDLRYAATVAPAQVHVYETYNPGALVAVTGFRGEREVDLWRGVDPTTSRERGGVSIIRIDDPFPTNRLRIYLNSTAVSGWNEIDAVGIVDDRGRTHWAMAVTASSCYAGEDHPPFVIQRDALVQLFARKPDLMKQLRRELKLDGTDFDGDVAPRRLRP